MTAHLKINCVMRNNQWRKHQNVFETIKTTKKLICPSGHRKNISLKNENGIYSYDKMCWQANKFLNDIKENDIVLLYDRQYKEALVLRITSSPIKDEINDVVILRNETCTHDSIMFGCPNCSSSVEQIFLNNLQNMNKYNKIYKNEDFHYETMHAIFREVEIIGKINTTSEIYHIHKCLQTSIRMPLKELLSPINVIIPI